MRLALRPATDEDLPFCQSLTRRNMSGYLSARGDSWDERCFLAKWAEFENLIILADSQVVGLLRLAPEGDALGARDLQVVPERQGHGIGSWAIQQAQSMAVRRGVRRLQLRVYEENPAKALCSLRLQIGGNCGHQSPHGMGVAP